VTARSPLKKPVSSYYQIEKGDSLSKNDKKFNTTVEQIMTRNPKITNENLICAGDYPYIRQ
jgi:LysM repeat protein